MYAIYVGYLFVPLPMVYLPSLLLVVAVELFASPVASCQCCVGMVVCYAVNLSLPQRSRLSVSVRTLAYFGIPVQR